MSVVTTYRGGSAGKQRVWLAFVIILLNSQIFLGTVANPFGIDGVQEAFYGILVVWSLASLFSRQPINGSLRALDFSVVIVTVMLVLYGAFAAKLTYGQPLLYGLIEERRALALLVYFPMMTLLRRGWIDTSTFERVLIASGAICALLAFGVWFEAVPALQSELRAGSLRGVRVAIGGPIVAIGIPLLLARRNDLSIQTTASLLLLLLGALLFVSQTRQLMLASLVASVVVMRGPRILIIPIIAGFSIYMALLFIPELSERLTVLVQLFDQLTTEDYLTESWRGLSYDYAIGAIESGELMGHGGLSPLWGGGFASVIGPYFYLADIGIVGSLFRYGLFGALIYAIYLLIQFRLIRSIPNHYHRTLYGGIFAFVLVSLPTAAPLEYRGNITGMLLAVSAYLALDRRRNAGT